jgi:predicted nucleic acid-binding Zn ribbon protein
MGYVISCLVCGGKGNVLIAQPAGQCLQCGGSGRRNVTSPCLTCAGTGWGRVFSQN